MNQNYAEQWEQAICAEYGFIIKNSVWTLVSQPTNVIFVKTRWVLHIKDIGWYKACFCTKGFSQQLGEDYDETFVPVAKYNSARIQFALIASLKEVKVQLAL